MRATQWTFHLTPPAEGLLQTPLQVPGSYSSAQGIQACLSAGAPGVTLGLVEHSLSLPGSSWVCASAAESYIIGVGQQTPTGSDCSPTSRGLSSV